MEAGASVPATPPAIRSFIDFQGDFSLFWRGNRRIGMSSEKMYGVEMRDDCVVRVIYFFI